MMRMFAVATAAAALAAAPSAQADGGFTKEPTAVGTGGAAATIDALATKAAIRTHVRCRAVRYALRLRVGLRVRSRELAQPRDQRRGLERLGPGNTSRAT